MKGSSEPALTSADGRKMGVLHPAAANKNTVCTQATTNDSSRGKAHKRSVVHMPITVSPPTIMRDKVFHLLDTLIRRLITCQPLTPPEKLFTFDELMEVCLRSRELLLVEPTFLDINPPLFVFGDIHGQLADLQKMLNTFGPPPKHSFLFLGDYVDRGAHSIETITLLLCYKLRYPRMIYLLRGNHETRWVNREYGFYDECQRKFPEKGTELWTQFQHVFNCLPLAARIGRKIFCAHGGISEDLCTFKQFDRVHRPTDICDIGLLCDLIWSDPSTITATYAPSPRGVSAVFGRQAIVDFCGQLGVDLICRAHQVVMDGYEFFADKRCVTIFSAPCYCGEVDNAAGVLHVTKTLQCRVITYRCDRVARGGKVVCSGSVTPSASPSGSSTSASC